MNEQKIKTKVILKVIELMRDNQEMLVKCLDNSTNDMYYKAKIEMLEFMQSSLSLLVIDIKNLD